MTDSAREAQNEPSPGDDSSIEKNLLRISHMFSVHRDNPLMRELCRLAIKCAQERLIHG